MQLGCDGSDVLQLARAHAHELEFAIGWNEGYGAIDIKTCEAHASVGNNAL